MKTGKFSPLRSAAVTFDRKRAVWRAVKASRRRCCSTNRANIAHVYQSRANSGPGLLKQNFKTCNLCSLRSAADTFDRKRAFCRAVNASRRRCSSTRSRNLELRLRVQDLGFGLKGSGMKISGERPSQTLNPISRVRQRDQAELHSISQPRLKGEGVWYRVRVWDCSTRSRNQP